MASGIRIGEAFIEVSADGRNAFRGLDGEASAAGTRSGGLFGDTFGKGIAKIGGLLAGAFAGAKIVDYIGGAITKASDLNEEVSKSQQIFGSSASDIQKWASTAATSLGMSSLNATQVAGNFGSMFTQLGYGSKVASKMSEDTVQLAADLGSFNNVPTADVADMISASLRGEYDGLQRLIPGINAARVEQEAMHETGKKSAAGLTAQEKAAATLAIIHKDGAKAQGDFARTSGGLANQTKITTAKFDDMQAQLGTKLLPIASNFMSFLNTNLLPALQGVGDFITTNIVPAFVNMGTWIQQNSGWLLPLVGVIGGLALALGIAAVAIGAYNIVQAILTAETIGATLAAMGLNAALLLNPFTWIVVGIVALIAAIVWVATQTTFFQTAWSVMSNAIGTAWNWLWNSVLSPVFNFIGAAIGVIGNVAMGLWTNFISPAIHAIASIFQWIYNSIIQPIAIILIATFVLIGLGVSTLWNMYVAPAIRAIGSIFQWVWNSIISPVANWIGGAVRNLGSIIQSLWNTYVSPAIHAVGQVFQWLWNNVISPVANWIGGAIRNLSGVVGGVFNGMATTMKNAFNGVAGVVSGVINGVIDMVNGGIGGINGFIDVANKVPGVSLPHLGTIPHLAKGGTLMSSGIALVGEKGPEVVSLPKGATVHPTGTYPGQSGGGSTGVTNIYVTIDAKNVKDFNSVVDIMNNVSQTSRSGRGAQNVRVV